MLRCSRHTVYRHVRDGSLPALRIGAAGPLRFRRGDVQTLLQPAAHSERTRVRFGTWSSEAAPPDDRTVRRARVEQTRRMGWEEIPAERLRPRGHGLLVDAESDAAFLPFRGVTFEPGSAKVYADRQTGLAFYVDEAGWPVVLERQSETWSEMFARRARRSATR